MCQTRSLVVCTRRLDLVVKQSKVLFCASGHPFFSALVPTNTAKPAAAAFTADVSIVLGDCAFAQIARDVIPVVTVSMIEWTVRPVPIKQDKNNTMRGKRATKYRS
jgi:hypothetical protein